MPALRSLLRGSVGDRPRVDPRIAAAPACFAVAFAGYATGVLGVDGGVILVAGDAALVGLLAAAALGARRRGLLAAWAAAAGALLGHRADHYLLGLSGRSLGERVAALADVEGAAVLVVAAVAVGGLGWVVGTGLRLAAARVRGA